MIISTEFQKRLVCLLQPGPIRAVKTNKLEVIRTAVLPGDKQVLPREYLPTSGARLSSKSKDSRTFQEAHLLLGQAIVN